MAHSVIAQALGGHSVSHQSTLWWVVLGLFGVTIAALVVAYRRTRSQVELERAEAILRQHDDSDH